MLRADVEYRDLGARYLNAGTTEVTSQLNPNMRIPIQDSFDNPRVLGAAGGWIAPAADVAHWIASLAVSDLSNPRALLTRDEVAPMWQILNDEYENTAAGVYFGSHYSTHLNVPGFLTVFHHNGAANGGTSLAMLRDGVGVVLIIKYHLNTHCTYSGGKETARDAILAECGVSC